MVQPGQRSGFVEVANGVFAFIPEADGVSGGTNGGFIVGDDWVLVIEAYLMRSIAERVIAEIKRVTTKPVRFLVYTHSHGDHIYGGELLLPAAVVGHRACRDEIIEKWDASVKRYSAGRPQNAAEFANVRMTLPDVISNDRLTLNLGSHRLELIYLGRAHSTGDILIHLPKEKVLFTGDVLVNGRTPYTADGYITSWQNVLDDAQSIDADVVVPGHGPIGDKQVITGLQEFFVSLQKQVREQFAAGKPEEEAIGELRFPEFGGWQGIQNLAPPVHRLYMEYNGQL